MSVLKVKQNNQWIDIPSITGQSSIPAGGTTGQVLKKVSGTDYDTEWANESGSVTDVQVNGTSILNNGVANVPVASMNTFGAVQVAENGLLGISYYTSETKRLCIARAGSSEIKAGNGTYAPIVSRVQHESTFYGLAKAAGDTTQASSDNAVGTYTSAAKTAIQTMLGLENGVSYVETVSGSTPVITGVANTTYKCGEVSTISITPPNSGTIDVMFSSGSTATVLTLPNTVKMPEWFNQNSLDINTTYEIMIVDGVYGSVISWAA